MLDYEKKININKISTHTYISDTKAFATKKLLQIALAINLSRKKMER